MAKNLYTQFLSELNDILSSTIREDVEDYILELIKIEEEFKKKLNSYKSGAKVYQNFIKHITETQKNIRECKVFFREREDVVSNKIPNDLRTCNTKNLAKYRINFRFMKWSMDHDCPNKPQMLKILNRASAVRQNILTQNLPLIINRSRLFQMKAKKNNIDYSDLMQIASEGFIDAIDKYVPEVYGNFKSVSIGRMSSKMSSESMESMVKLSSEDKKILYRANIAKYKLKYDDFDKIFSFVRESYPRIKKNQLQDIMMSSSGTSSIDVMKDKNVGLREGFGEAPETQEYTAVDKDLKQKLIESIDKLGYREQKVIKLKGSIR
jgi:DNA-directed RNA polymerase specialized sigma subunit